MVGRSAPGQAADQLPPARGFERVFPCSTAPAALGHDKLHRCLAQYGLHRGRALCSPSCPTTTTPRRPTPTSLIGYVDADPPRRQPSSPTSPTRRRTIRITCRGVAQPACRAYRQGLGRGAAGAAQRQRSWRACQGSSSPAHVVHSRSRRAGAGRPRPCSARSSCTRMMKNLDFHVGRATSTTWRRLAAGHHHRLQAAAGRQRTGSCRGGHRLAGSPTLFAAIDSSRHVPMRGRPALRRLQGRCRRRSMTRSASTGLGGGERHPRHARR